MTTKTLYPQTYPSLNLDFAGTKKLDPRVTFTRTTTARYYDGVTTAKAEENLLLRSQELNQSSFWVPGTNVTVSTNTTTAPDGTSTAETIIETSTTEAHALLTSASLNYISGQSYAYSVFLKKGDGATAPDWMQLTFSAAGFAGTDAYRANFDLQNGVLGTVGASVTAAITSVGNGWYRCSIVATAVASTTGGQAQIVFTNNADAGRRPSYTGQTTSNVFAWGAQLEQRSAVTAYTPTTTQPITNYIPVLQTAAAGVARFDHNPITSESLGLLVEEQRSNLVTHSEEFNNAAWIKTRSSIVANTIVAPDGTLTGNKLVEDTTANNTHTLGDVITTTAAAHTFSFYAKAAERGFVRCGIFDGTSFYLAYFNLTDGSVGTLLGAGTSASTTAVGNGWYRFSVTATTAASASSQAVIRLATANGTDSYTGDGYSGIYIWGAQLEAGAFPTSYIPTVGSTVTRNADAASMTGVNFSSWFNNAEGTVYSNFSSFRPADSANAFAYDITQNVTNYIAVRTAAGYTPDRIFPAVFFENAAQFTGESTVTTGYLSMPVGSVKNALAYKTNDFASSWNGVTPLLDTSGTLPTPVSLFLGVNGSQNAFLNGHIRKLAYYPTRLSDAQLVALTA